MHQLVHVAEELLIRPFRTAWSIDLDHVLALREICGACDLGRAGMDGEHNITVPQFRDQSRGLISRVLPLVDPIAGVMLGVQGEGIGQLQTAPQIVNGFDAVAINSNHSFVIIRRKTLSVQLEGESFCIFDQFKHINLHSVARGDTNILRGFLSKKV